MVEFLYVENVDLYTYKLRASERARVNFSALLYEEWQICMTSNSDTCERL